MLMSRARADALLGRVQFRASGTYDLESYQLKFLCRSVIGMTMPQASLGYGIEFNV